MARSYRERARARAMKRALAAALLACAAAGCRRAPRRAGGPRAYVSNEAAGTVSVIDPEDGAVVATIPVGRRPRGMRLSPDGRTLYVALSGSPAVPPGGAERDDVRPAPDRSADGIAVVDLA